MIKVEKMADLLWGKNAKFSYLLVAAVVLLFTFLGAREIWTQEHRWADIVMGMFFRQDYLHPYIGEVRYYDKPLLSYWLIVLVAKVTGILSTWVLRLPSALAGLLAIWSIYRLGATLKDRQLGLLSGWLLLTTFYFVFWARTSSADMLNLAGSLFAVAWYYEKKERAGWFDYAVFFMILSLTALCKGLVGAIVPLLAVFVDMVLHKSWKQHLGWKLLFSAIPACVVYVLPFWLSSHFGGEAYGQSGLYLVYRENILRYFKPFDHKGPIYTYFQYLPLYMMPCALFFIPALVTVFSRWKTMTINSKWIAWTLLVVFLFFTLSGSRRSYYVLPIVPFGILFTADWILSAVATSMRQQWVAVMVVVSYVVLFLGVDVVPAWYYNQYGVNRFAVSLQEEVNKVEPWGHWNVVMLDAESKLDFYLQLPPTTKHYEVKGDRESQTLPILLQAWPIVLNQPPHTIFITRKVHAALLQPYFMNYDVFELPSDNVNAPIAFVPKK